MSKVPVVCFVGWSKSGKTKLLQALISEARKKGLRVAALKHTHKTLDQKGKDTYRMRLSGAEPVILVAKDGVLVLKHGEISLDDVINDLAKGVDLVFAEGFKSSSYPKIEVYSGGIPIHKDDPNVLAIVTEENLESKIPIFRPWEVDKILEFIIHELSLSP